MLNLWNDVPHSGTTWFEISNDRGERMRWPLLSVAVLSVAISGSSQNQLAQQSFAPPPQVPADRVLIVSADAVALAQTRVPGVGTTLYDGGTFAASGLKRNNAEEGPVRHAVTTEVYVIQSGSGTYTSGGTLVGPLTQHPVPKTRLLAHQFKAASLTKLKPATLWSFRPEFPISSPRFINQLLM